MIIGEVFAAAAVSADEQQRAFARGQGNSSAEDEVAGDLLPGGGRLLRHKRRSHTSAVAHAERSPTVSKSSGVELI